MIIPAAASTMTTKAAQPKYLSKGRFTCLPITLVPLVKRMTSKIRGGASKPLMTADQNSLSGGSASILRNTRWLFSSRVLEVSDERSLTRARNRATPANCTVSARTSRSLAPSESSVWRTGKANYNINPDIGTGRGRAE